MARAPFPPDPFGSQALDPDTLDTESALEYESELVIGRRSFVAAQKYLSTFVSVVSTISNVSLSWHDTAVDLNEGSFAVVQSGSDLEDLVGEIVRVKVGRRTVFAYVVAESSMIQVDMTLAQRPFMAVGLLAQKPAGLRASLQVMS